MIIGDKKENGRFELNNKCIGSIREVYSDLAEWQKEMESIKLLPDDSLERLERFAILFTRTMNLIATALSKNQTVPHAVFAIRDYLVEEITADELEYVLSHVHSLCDKITADKTMNEKISESETK